MKIRWQKAQGKKSHLSLPLKQRDSLHKQKDRLAAVSPKSISNFDQAASLAVHAARGTSFFITALASISA